MGPKWTRLMSKAFCHCSDTVNYSLVFIIATPILHHHHHHTYLYHCICIDVPLFSCSRPPQQTSLQLFLFSPEHFTVRISSRFVFPSLPYPYPYLLSPPPPPQHISFSPHHLQRPWFLNDFTAVCLSLGADCGWLSHHQHSVSQTFERPQSSFPPPPSLLRRGAQIPSDVTCK